MKRQVSDPVSYLTERRYPEARNVAKHSLELAADIFGFDCDLRELPQDQLFELVRQEKRKELIEAQFGRHVDDRHRHFASAAFDADFQHWARMLPRDNQDENAATNRMRDGRGRVCAARA